MLCIAYRLRHQGQKLDPDAIRRGGRVGELTYRQRLIGKRPEWHLKNCCNAWTQMRLRAKPSNEKRARPPFGCATTAATDETSATRYSHDIIDHG